MPRHAADAQRSPADTPFAWRLASLGILLGGALGGRAIGRRRTGGAAVVLLVGVVGGLLSHLGRAGRRAREGAAVNRSSRATSPQVTVVIAARDEVGVISHLIADLARQDHRDPVGRPRFEVVVIDDRSTDGTGEAVRRQARAMGLASVMRVDRRAGLGVADGKGAALAAVPLESCREAIVVLDADSRIAPDFLRLAATRIAAGSGAVQARRRVLAPARHSMARLQADEQTVDGALQLGRGETGRCSEFRGNGMVVRRDVLIAVGGWRAGCLTEDLDLSSRIAARMGCGVTWAWDLEVWESPAERSGDLWAQRLRWAEGSIRRYLEHGPEVLRSRRLSRMARLDFALYGAQLLAPPIVAGIVVGAVVDRRARQAAFALAGCAVVGLVLAYDALDWEMDADGAPLDRRSRTIRAAAVTTFEGLWMLVVPAALWRLATRRGSPRFAKTPHRPESMTEPPWRSMHSRPIRDEERPGSGGGTGAGQMPGMTAMHTSTSRAGTCNPSRCRQWTRRSSPPAERPSMGPRTRRSSGVPR